MPKIDSNKTIGIIANPHSSRDVRRLVSSATSIPSVERANILERILMVLGSFGLKNAYMMPDNSGLSTQLMRSLRARAKVSERPQPALNFLDMPITASAEDTRLAAKLMRQQAVDAIIVMGGDGTHRDVAMEVNSIPLACLSTGTNNAFPAFHEATLVGMALAILLNEKLHRGAVLHQNKSLRVHHNQQEVAMALVDAAVTADLWKGSRAVWQMAQLQQLFLAFCEPTAIGMSSIGGLVAPVSRQESFGRCLSLTDPGIAATRVQAPVAPGMITEIGISSVSDMLLGIPVEIQAQRGTLALDGEREIEFGPADKLSIVLDERGPVTLDVNATIELATGGFCTGAAIDSLSEAEELFAKQ